MVSSSFLATSIPFRIPPHATLQTFTVDIPSLMAKLMCGSATAVARMRRVHLIDIASGSPHQQTAKPACDKSLSD